MNSRDLIVIACLKAVVFYLFTGLGAHADGNALVHMTKSSRKDPTFVIKVNIFYRAAKQAYTAMDVTVEKTPPTGGLPLDTQGIARSRVFVVLFVVIRPP